MTAVAVDSERILKDLRKLWRDLAKEDPNAVLRACTMTLIVFADETLDAQLTGETLALLMHEHPSRAIVIRVRETSEPLLEARVFAQCWMPFGRRQQICCEQVEILCSPGNIIDVEAVVRGILAPDLPVVLYAPSRSLCTLLQQGLLTPVASKLVLDSCGVQNSAAVPSLLADSRIRVAQKADLVWSRLTPWREAIAEIFDDPARLRSLYDLTEVQILYKAPEEPSAVYYLAGWFMHVLGAGVKLNIAPGVGPEYANIAQVAMYGPKFQASVAITGRLTAETTIGDQPPRVTVFPVANEYYALRQELSLTGRDPVFHDVLGLVKLMRSPA
jgi:glucose-6-phosphate dehydrogenase assembly protein OpcA